MNAVSIAVALAYLLAAAGFVAALHLMNSLVTARRGSRLSWLGMIVAVAAALVSVIHDATITTAGGSSSSPALAVARSRPGHGQAGQDDRRPAGRQHLQRGRRGAAALVAVGEVVRLAGGAGISTQVMIATVLDIIIGPVTFSGS